MANDSEPRKKRARHGFRYQMELYFASEDAKQAFLSRMEDAERQVAPPRLDNCQLISSLLDKVDRIRTAAPSNSPSENLADGEARSQSRSVPAVPMLENSGL